MNVSKIIFIFFNLLYVSTLFAQSTIFYNTSEQTNPSDMYLSFKTTGAKPAQCGVVIVKPMNVLNIPPSTCPQDETLLMTATPTFSSTKNPTQACAGALIKPGTEVGIVYSANNNTYSCLCFNTPCKQQW